MQSYNAAHAKTTSQNAAHAKKYFKDFRLGSLAWELSPSSSIPGRPRTGGTNVPPVSSDILLGNFRLGTLAWEASLENFRLGTLAWELSLGNFRLGPLDWDLRLGEAGSCGWGNRLAGAGGTRGAGLLCLVFKILSKNPSK